MRYIKTQDLARGFKIQPHNMFVRVLLSLSLVQYLFLFFMSTITCAVYTSIELLAQRSFTFPIIKKQKRIATQIPIIMRDRKRDLIRFMDRLIDFSLITLFSTVSTKETTS